MIDDAFQIGARLILAAGVSIIFATAPQAAERIAYVSSTGKNVNACALASPCRSLSRGIKATAAGGELHVLDSATYGSGTIGKSMTIAGHGATLDGTSITIDGTGVVVTLRDLVLNGGDIAENGVLINVAEAAYIERCTIYGFTNDGIRLPDLGSTASLFVSNTSSRNNGQNGLVAVGTAGSKRTIVNSRFENNGGGGVVLNSSQNATVTSVVSADNGSHGFSIGLAARATIVRSTAANNAQTGFVVGGSAHMIIEDSVASGNTTGVLIFAGVGTAAVSNSVVTRNSVGLQNSGSGVLLSRGNNTVFDNTTNVSGTITSLSAL